MITFRKRAKSAICALCCIVIMIALCTDAVGSSPLEQSRSRGDSVEGADTAILTIVSDAGKSEGNHGVPCYGHTFLVLENTGDEKLIFCGRVLEPGENITFGWWAISSHGGVWFGLESNYIDAYGRYPDRVSLSRVICAEGIYRLADYLLANDVYTPLENCAVRAVAAFNAALAEDRELKSGYFTTPARVSRQIIAHGGTYEEARALDFTEQLPSCGFDDDVEYYYFVIKKAAG